MPPKEASVAHILLKVSELTRVVAEFAGAEHHSNKTSKIPRTKEQKEAHTLLMQKNAVARKQHQDFWMSENKPDQVDAYNEAYENYNADHKAKNDFIKASSMTAKEKHDARNAENSKFAKEMRELMKKYGIPAWNHPSQNTMEGGETVGARADDMEAQFDHDLWQQNPQGYPMRDSLRYL